ncbi:MAG: hypothetical protein ACOCY8_05640 [Spirochaetota bacterium]
MLFGGIIVLIVAGLVGWWFGSYRATMAVNRQWMRSLEQAETDGIIDEHQRSDIIRIQNAERQA